ncbi:hypothetical protein NC99_11670 [Sunxiuqinia dokdonensis]|uniref:Uncharacterized protein n=1 Tax=Sunxiuqinia dokdonensis TaxID=1409788 RepID=A0A0L8VCX5_9BACT|nr:hypothetical protein NC99_11670 [Sunxiuqinia dokdonensis]
MAGQVLEGIQGCAPERKNPEAGRRVTLTRFFPPFHRLEKEVPVRHKDKEVLIIKQTLCDAAHAGREHPNTE